MEIDKFVLFVIQLFVLRPSSISSVHPVKCNSSFDNHLTNKVDDWTEFKPISMCNAMRIM